MKKPKNNTELAHRWAHPTSPDEAQSCSNFRFDGPLLYSYNTVIGLRLIAPNDEPAFVLNSASFSKSTSKHQCLARRAVYGATFWIKVPYRGGSMAEIKNGADLVAEYVRQAGEPLADADRRSKLAEARAISDRYRLFEKAQHAAQAFGLQWPVFDQELREAYERARPILEALERKRDERWAKREELAEKRRLRAAERLRANIPAWLAGQNANVHDLPVMLRCIRFAGALEIQTSRGAVIPYEDGKRCFEFAMKMKAKGWHRKGEQFHVGSYGLDAVNEFGIIAGCHRIGWDEIERFATQEGWITAPLSTEQPPDINNPALDFAEASLTPEQ